ncbi:MAG TPA: hypothetical protein VD816_15130 [Ohtaekwangia sp.]|nr:hypothetical protein [Ohtaekwangia sp.]
MIRYLYRETTEVENKELEKALLCDSELKALYNELCAMKVEMDEARLQPSAGTVLNILSYARSLQEKRS